MAFRVVNSQAVVHDRICRFQGACRHGPTGANCPFYHVQRLNPREVHLAQRSETDSLRTNMELTQCRQDIAQLQRVVTAMRTKRTRRRRRRRVSGSSEEYDAKEWDIHNERKDHEEVSQLSQERNIMVERDKEVTALASQLEQERKLVVERDKEVTALASQLAQKRQLVVERDKEVTALASQLAQEHKLVVEHDKEVTALTSQLAQERKLVVERNKLKEICEETTSLLNTATQRQHKHSEKLDVLRQEHEKLKRMYTGTMRAKSEAAKKYARTLCSQQKRIKELETKEKRARKPSKQKVTAAQQQRKKMLKTQRNKIDELQRQLETVATREKQQTTSTLKAAAATVANPTEVQSTQSAVTTATAVADNMSMNINANVPQTKYSNKFQEICAMIEQGRTPDDVQQIDDMPPDPHAPPTESVLSQPQKPFEGGVAKEHGLSWFEQYEAQQETRDNEDRNETENVESTFIADKNNNWFI